MIKFFKKHFHLKYRDVYVHAKKLFIFDIALLCLGVFLLAASLFFFFWRPGLTDLIDIKFSFGGERFLSGQEMTVSIDYTNRSKETLQNAELAVHLPPGFIIDREKTPIDLLSDQSIFTLNNIKPGGTGHLLIHGVFYAEPGVNNKITAFLTYTPEEKTKKEQKISGAIMLAAGSVLEVETGLTEQTLPGQKLPVTIKIKNNGQSALNNINMYLGWPESFIDEPTHDLTLESGATREFSGVITAPQEAGEHKFSGTVNIIINNQPITQAWVDKTITVLYPELNISGTLTTDKAYLESGAQIPIKINWQNKSDFELENLKIVLSPDPKIVNLSATARENNLKLVNNQLVLDKSNRTALANGQPGNGEEFTLNLIFLPKISPNTATFACNLAISAQVPGVADQVFTKETTTNALPLATEVSLLAEVRYYTPAGDQIGRGALPPQVGEETKYWIINRIKNTSNEIKDLYFTAKLGNGVKLAEKQSVTIGNKLEYNAGTNSVTWSYPSAPPNSEVGLFFEVSVTPTGSDVGKELLLVKSVDFGATDAVVGKKFNLSAKNIYNILPNDDNGRVKGARVVK